VVVLHAGLAGADVDSHARSVHLARIDSALVDGFVGRAHGKLHCAAHEFVVLGKPQR
jgi:hypothetical protein